MTETAQSQDPRGDIGGVLATTARRWLRPTLIGLASIAAAVAAALITSDPGGGLNPLVEGASGASSGALGDLGLLLPFGFAFAAGMASATNPCGFALLPAYIGLLLSRSAGESPQLSRRLGSATLIALAVTIGFIVLFASVGLLVGASGQAVTGIFPVIGLVVGVLLIGAGAYRLGGGMLYSAAPERLSARLGAGSTGPRGYLLFGLTYGIASLSCTLPIFLAVLGGSLATASLGDTLVQMVLYGLGMGFVISLLTMAVALFRESMQRWLKGAMRWADPLGTAFLFVAGMYIVYYWLTIGGLLDG
ncbi:MAG TPA: cytochrome c biogenesis protein CcdA [Candidatus Limnocylindrales bacterium]|nr:cytochrome c biogenesis protein CcdA [Candidatus Limnocylindrales bacterium]